MFKEQSKIVIQLEYTEDTLGQADNDKNTFEQAIDDTAEVLTTGIDAITTPTNVCNEVTIAPAEIPDDVTDGESVGKVPTIVIAALNITNTSHNCHTHNPSSHVVTQFVRIDQHITYGEEPLFLRHFYAWN